MNINPSIDYMYAMEDCKSVLELADGRTKQLDGETKLLGHDDKWVTRCCQKKKTGVINFTTIF